MAQFHRAKGRPQVPPDDGLVILPAALPWRAILDPVVAEVAESLLRRRRVPDATADLFGFDLALAQLGLGASESESKD